MQNLTQEKLFHIGMWWRIGYGFLRIIFGFAILNMVGLPLVDVLKILMSHELIEDPNDMLFALASHFFSAHPLYISYFLSFYFIFWGVIDVVLSYNIIKHRLWAFPMSFIFIGLFLIYEVVRFIHSHSLIVLWVILIDTGILWIMWREYKKLKTTAVH